MKTKLIEDAYMNSDKSLRNINMTFLSISEAVNHRRVSNNPANVLLASEGWLNMCFIHSDDETSRQLPIALLMGYTRLSTTTTTTTDGRLAIYQNCHGIGPTVGRFGEHGTPVHELMLNKALNATVACDNNKGSDVERDTCSGEMLSYLDTAVALVGRAQISTTSEDDEPPLPDLTHVDDDEPMVPSRSPRSRL